MRYFLAWIVSVFGFLVTLQACVPPFAHNNHFHVPGPSNPPENHLGSADQNKYVRPLYKTSLSPQNRNPCECGLEESSQASKWRVTVTTVNLPGLPSRVTCHGTVVAHNLVVTSHKCLAPKGKRLQVYEAWYPQPKGMAANMASFKNVMISIPDPDHPVAQFKVKTIVYNMGYYGFDDDKHAASANDVVVIVVDGDLFSPISYMDPVTHQEKVYDGRYPVCIPEMNKENKDLLDDIIHRYGYHYSIAGYYVDGTTPKIIQSDQLVIFDGKECDKELGLSSFSTFGCLCIRNITPLTDKLGAPLLTTNEKGYYTDTDLTADPQFSTQTAWLLGLSTVGRKRLGGTHIDYTYFSNIIQNIPFIEKIAHDHGSLWCKTPRFAATPKENKTQLQKWPWELQPNQPRSETLDCACGLNNANANQRVASGEDATPYEFGWMVRHFFDYDPMWRSTRSCGASIINDRVILTASHCVVEYKDLANPNGVPFELNPQNRFYIKMHHFDFGKNPQTILVKVKELIPHPGFIPNYQHNVFSFDVALAILEEPLKFATATKQADVTPMDIRPICLPKTNKKIELNEGTLLTIMGWGVQYQFVNGTPPIVTSPEVLQKLQVPVRDRKYCADLATSQDTIICAGNFTTNYGSTQGDSGGPVTFIKQPNGQYFQVGVVSFLAPFLKPSRPKPVFSFGEEWASFYSDVQQFVPFIEYYSNLHGARWCKA